MTAWMIFFNSFIEQNFTQGVKNMLGWIAVRNYSDTADKNLFSHWAVCQFFIVFALPRWTDPSPEIPVLTMT